MTPGQFQRKREKLFPAATIKASMELAVAALGVTRQAVEH